MSGVPIGGYTSKVSASCVLAEAEHSWAQEFLAMRGVTWSKNVAQLRYVDDAIFLSRAFCHSCLCRSLSMYPCQFDVTSSGRRLVWLDIQICLGRLQVSFNFKGFATAPSWSSSRRALRSYMLGRISRAQEFELVGQLLQEFVLSLIHDMLACGWSVKDFRAILHSTAGVTQTPALAMLRNVHRALHMH